MHLCVVFEVDVFLVGGCWVAGVLCVFCLFLDFVWWGGGVKYDKYYAIFMIQIIIKLKWKCSPFCYSLCSIKFKDSGTNYY